MTKSPGLSWLMLVSRKHTASIQLHFREGILLYEGTLPASLLETIIIQLMAKILKIFVFSKCVLVK